MSKAKTEITRIEIYWDTQDPTNEGWAVRWDRIGDNHESGPIEGVSADNLDYAIDQACFDLGVSLNHDDFGCDEKTDGGYAIWTA